MIDVTPLLRLYARRRLGVLARQDAVAAQQATLLGLVRRAATTRFGRDHDFAAIRSVADYQARVPIRSYAQFWAEYWGDAYPVLENVSWPGRIPYFAFTSGTSSGASKFIPVSRDMVRANNRAGLDVFVHHLAHCPDSRLMGGKTFFLGGSTALVKVAPGVARGDLSGIAANEVPLFARPFSFPPKAAALEADWERKIERLVHLALGQDIRALAGTPSWMLPFLERLAEQAGRPCRMAALFPKLDLLVHGGVSFRPYAERFARLLDGVAAETREVYPASEGFLAVADQGPGQGMRLMADNGLFVEFVPAAELGASRPTRHWVKDVEPGVEYAVIVSSCAGLFSYVIGDLVRVVDRVPPRLLVSGRVSYQLNVFGEHLSGEQIEDALLAAAEGAEVVEYTAGARLPAGSSRGHHVFVVEFAQVPGDLDGFTRRLDAALCAGSLDYRERRTADVGLNAPQVVVVPPGFFAGWMKRRGRLGGQNKVPRVIADEAVLEELMQGPAT